MSRYSRPYLPAWATTSGKLDVPNGSPTGLPEPKSLSPASSLGALAGLKKSCALSAPVVAFGCSRTTDSASWPGGLSPGPLAGEMPLPEVKKIRFGPSDMSPPSLCQMPAWSSLTPASSVHRVDWVGVASTFTPDT